MTALKQRVKKRPGLPSPAASATPTASGIATGSTTAYVPRLVPVEKEMNMQTPRNEAGRISAGSTELKFSTM